MMQRAVLMRWDELATFYEHWGEGYCAKSHYLRIQDRPVCSLLNLTDFVAAYSLRSFSAMISMARNSIRSSCGVAPFMLGVFNEVSRYNVWLANRLPIDGVTGYGMLPNWRSAPVQNYELLMRQRVRDWYVMQASLEVPFLPVVTTGWDASVRGVQVNDLRSAPAFPWRPIVRDVTPQLFGFFLDCAARFNEATHPDLNVIFLHAWNEWTECSVLEPSDVFGTTLLEEIAKR
jgi:hypothetical protein